MVLAASASVRGLSRCGFRSSLKGACGLGLGLVSGPCCPLVTASVSQAGGQLGAASRCDDATSGSGGPWEHTGWFMRPSVGCSRILALVQILRSLYLSSSIAIATQLMIP